MIRKLGTKRVWNLAVSLLLQWRRRCEFIWGGMIGYSAAGLSKLRDLIISLLLPRDSQKTFVQLQRRRRYGFLWRRMTGAVPKTKEVL